MEYLDSLPVPVTQLGRVFSTSVIDPVGKETPHAKIHLPGSRSAVFLTCAHQTLPKTHDLSTAFGRCNFTDVCWASRKSDTLTDTNDRAPGDEATNVTWRES